MIVQFDWGAPSILQVLSQYDTFTGVQIGFEEVLYSVDESAGEVTLGVVILSGGLSSEVVVRLSTGDSSATGKRSPY